MKLWKVYNKKTEKVKVDTKTKGSSFRVRGDKRTRGKGVKAGGRVGGRRPSVQEHLLGVKTEELGEERKRDERNGEARDRLSCTVAA